MEREKENGDHSYPRGLTVHCDKNLCKNPDSNHYPPTLSTIRKLDAKHAIKHPIISINKK